MSIGIKKKKIKKIEEIKNINEFIRNMLYKYVKI